MRVVYTYFYALRKKRDYQLCDQILQDMDVWRLPPVVLIAVLTVTAPLREPLANRRTFFGAAKVAIEKCRGPEATGRLLAGLE